MSNEEARQIIEDIQQEFAEYIIEEIEDFTKVDCIKVTHFCSDKPDEELLICFELDIQKELLLFIRTHKMPQEVRPG